MIRSNPALALRLVRVGLHLAYGGLQTALLFPFLGQARRDGLKRRWSRQLLDLLGIDADFDDAYLAGLGNGLLVANHVSFVDIFAINAVLPSGFVAKSEVSGWPLIGWLCRHNETIFLARGNRRAAQDTRQQIGQVLATGRRLAIFPEGTTTAGDRVLPFHAALFQAAIDAGAPVHALCIAYTDRLGRPAAAVAYIDDLSLLDCLWAILRTDGLQVRVALAASWSAPTGDRRQLAHRCHGAIASMLHRQACTDTPQPFGNAAAIST